MTDVLLYAEDPGAANFVAPLQDALDEMGLAAVLIAEGPAAPYLDDQGVVYRAPESDAETTLDRHAPALVACGTSQNLDTMGLDLIHAARELDIPTLGLVDAYRAASRRFRGRSDDPLAYAPDLIAVPDDPTAKRFEELGVSAGRVYVGGHPRYDLARRLRGDLDGCDRARLRSRHVPGDPGNAPVLVFLAEPSPEQGPWRLVRSPEYTLTGRGHRDDRTAIVLEEVLDALDAVGVERHLVLRLHPKNRPDEFDDYADEVDAKSQGPGLHELLYASDLVVGMSSMALVEAVMLGRPTLSVLPRPSERNWLPTVRLGTTPCATARDELRRRLPDALGAGGQQPAFDPPDDAARRVAKMALRLLEGHL